MTKLHQIYKCEICGNIAEMVHAGQGEMACCGQPMKLQTEKLEDEGQEKHVPVVEKTSSGVLVKIGSVPHPMAAEHFIEWVEVITSGGSSFKKFFQVDDEPQADFCLNEEVAEVRIYCNIHGLWKNK